MAKHEQAGSPTPGLNQPAAEGADQRLGSATPRPSTSAAAAAGAVGPGALAAAEADPDAARDTPSPPAAGAVGGLTPDDAEALRALARRAGGVEALVRWLQSQPDWQ